MSTPVFDLPALGILLAALAVLVVRRRRGRQRWIAKLGVAVGAGVWIALSGAGLWALTQATAAEIGPLAVPPRATSPGNPCNAGQTPKTFNVSLINVPLFLNRFGDVVPEGRMYVLEENVAAVRTGFAQAANPFRAAETDLIEPLTLRVNQGDCVEIRFTNRLNEPAPNFVRNNSIFTLPGETLRAAGAVTPAPREFAPAATNPDNDFDPATAPNASMHFDGLDYDVRGSDGTVVGNNPDSTAPPGQTVTYRLFAQVEGEFQFKDGADFTSQQTRPVDTNGQVRFIGSHSFGAFGAIVVEAPGATWVNPRTGGPLPSGTRAIIKHPTQLDFREHVLFMHDEVEAEPGILTRFCRSGSDTGGNECINPSAAQLAKLTAGTLPGLGGGDADALINGEVPVKLEWFAFNYRAEPGFNREEVDCPAATRTGQGFDAAACIGEETSLSSWAFGDPGGGDLVFHNYRSEPMQIRLLHPAEFETHTFHWHVNRWPFDPKDEGGLAAISNPNHRTTTTNLLDVQAVSPGSHYGLIAQGGAGSALLNRPATFGDIIFHCHLYPHFATGMWGLNRTLDKRERGTRTNPDTTPIPALVPLEDHDYQPALTGRQDPPEPATTTPGFPQFVPGKFGFKAPKPPLGVPQRQTTGVFPPTALETAAADPGGQKPGGFFQDPCPAGRPTKTFNVAAIQIAQQYNDDLNWRNPQSRVYVLQEHKQAVLGGQKPEPFAPIVNVGDCVVYQLTNELPVQYGGNVFDRAQETNEVGIHQHMVQFDVLTSDGAANGWNYDQGADPGQTITYRDFVHENTATNSFHDHFFPNVHQDAGLFGGASIHPPGCTFHDPRSDATVRVGTLVDLHCQPTTDYRGQATDGEDYRNFSLFIEDHVPMFQPANPDTANDDQFVTPHGVPIFPAKFPSSTDDQGVMGINYRLEPFEARRDRDPSRLFADRLAFTPLLGAYEGDKVKFRLFQLSQEESHGFNLDRFRWKFEPKDPESNVVQAQHIGMLEYFDVRVDLGFELENPSFTSPQERDYLYHYGGADDWFLGTWGILTVAGCQRSFLPPGALRTLPDNFVEICDEPEPSAAEDGGAGVNATDVCPTGAPLKQFNVAAINVDIRYNNAGDHDPNGLMYALEQDVTAIRSGAKAPEPLVIRVNAGDCIQVTLRNALDPAKMVPHCHEAIEPGQLGFREGVLAFPACIDQPPNNEVNVPGFQPFPVSARVSMRPQLVNYHYESAGSSVGRNTDSTVAPGTSRIYRWFAPPDVTGLALLEDRADVQNHLHHGLYGALVIEPAGSSYLDPRTGQPLASGTSAVITHPTQPDFRENIVLLNSDLALFRADGQPVPDNFDLVNNPSREANDPEDQGEFSVNYRNAPWSHRFAVDRNITNIFSSFVHGDPATPLFQAYNGDKTVFRVAQAVGDPRSTSFALHDHVWRRSPADPQSQIAATQGQFNPGVVYNIHLDPAVTGGAGGRRAVAGDYLYRTSTLARHLTGGQWGLFRVHASQQPNLIALPDRPVPASTSHEPAMWPAAAPPGRASYPARRTVATSRAGAARRRRRVRTPNKGVQPR
jgi:manganese oxidase